MDKVFIKGLHIQTTIGCYQWEKEMQQTLVIDLVMAWDTAKAAKNDELDKTLNYAEISTAIATYANENTVDLVETLTERLAAFLMAEFDIPWLKLKIGKPGAVHNADTVGVEIERGQLNNTQSH